MSIIVYNHPIHQSGVEFYFVYEYWQIFIPSVKMTNTMSESHHDILGLHPISHSHNRQPQKNISSSNVLINFRLPFQLCNKAIVKRLYWVWNSTK
jgi:hypothetical protein